MHAESTEDKLIAAINKEPKRAPAPQVEMVSELQSALARAVEMLRIAGRVAETHAPDAIVHYDEADCDGTCIATDCTHAADDLERLQAALNARAVVTVDALAQEIRRVDGDHSLGAGALAEALLPFIALNARAGGDGWLPIESAPKDGRGVFAFWGTNTRVDERSYGVAAFVGGDWCNADNTDDIYGEPTHWQPLPTPPAALASQAVGVKP